MSKKYKGYICSLIVMLLLSNIINTVSVQALEIQAKSKGGPNGGIPSDKVEGEFQWNPRCDINNDFVIDYVDRNEVSLKLGTTPNSSNWNPKCDINSDGIVDTFDLDILAKAFGTRLNPIEYVSAKEIESRIDEEVRPEFKNVVNSDEKLLSFYNSTPEEQEVQLKTEANQLDITSKNNFMLYNNTMSLGFTSTLSELNNELILLGIPASLRYALVAEGAGITAALADGPIPFGDVAAIVISIGVGFVVASNWSIIEEKGTEILNVFNRLFGNISTQITYRIEYAVSETFEMIENASEEKQVGESKLPVVDKPNSTKERVKDGKVVQRRHYGSDGKARVDEDFSDHGTPHLHSNPHYHTWDWSSGYPKRSKTINEFD
ncbi:hypothetical protein NSA50_17835 [Clostridium sp. DSM 100503]|uniref:dockerin type I domain-containing protein n=1 Tax=Clostridium sp. DSM 100503 TaxID=2963282 RepID=UPI002149F691|nr:dockerin type I domain-containing protein [Clostridium sp. DSM 100503]MCR1952865.1 hypothetical protein [Clostridium sp. DSM 100503]